LSTAPQIDINLADEATLPSQLQLSHVLLSIDGYDDFFKQSTKHFFAITIRCCWRGPDSLKVGS